MICSHGDAIRRYFQTSKGGVMCVEVFMESNNVGQVTICAGSSRAAARHTVRSWRRLVGRRARRGRVGESTGLAGLSDLRRAVEVAEQMAMEIKKTVLVSGCTPRLEKAWSRALSRRPKWAKVEDNVWAFSPA